jgi:SAM-dependent methyltransferase
MRAAVLKQLPPSASQLRLADVGAAYAELLAQARPDVLALPASLDVSAWAFEPSSLDAVVAYDVWLSPAFLQASLQALREGGRLVVVLPYEAFDVAWGQLLEANGYVRVLVEPAGDDGAGVLLRGERAHTQSDTLARVRLAHEGEADALSLATYRGRFVTFLVRQTPNKPVWRIAPDERIVWEAVTHGEALLGFTSLPKAVSFMQGAVLANAIRDVNKFPKFRKETVQAWGVPVLLNPSVGALNAPFGTRPLEPTQAEAPDE